jgi:hypothetical protein
VPARGVLLLLLSLAFNSDAIAQNVRIGVLGLFHPRQLTLQASRHDAVILHAGVQTFILEPGSPMAASFRISGDQLFLDFGGKVLRVSELHASARNGGAGTFLLTVPGKVTRSYHGTLDVKISHGEVVPIVTMDLETAVASAVAAESSSDTPPEALKAQAVVARSYFLAGGGRHREFDFCDLRHLTIAPRQWLPVRRAESFSHLRTSLLPPCFRAGAADTRALQPNSAFPVALIPIFLSCATSVTRVPIGGPADCPCKTPQCLEEVNPGDSPWAGV